MPYNYMLSSMNQLYYPTYPYANPQYGTNAYHSTMNSNSWRDMHYGGVTGMGQMMPRNYFTQENSRVAMREGREKEAPQIINLDSEE